MRPPESRRRHLRDCVNRRASAFYRPAWCEVRPETSWKGYLRDQIFWRFGDAAREVRYAMIGPENRQSCIAMARKALFDVGRIREDAGCYGPTLTA